MSQAQSIEGGDQVGPRHNGPLRLQIRAKHDPSLLEIIAETERNIAGNSVIVERSVASGEVGTELYSFVHQYEDVSQVGQSTLPEH